MLEECAPMVGAHSLLPDLAEMEFCAPRIAGTVKPGQFLMVRVGPWQDPLLGRPLGVTAVRGDRVVLMVAAMGRGSRALLSMKPGDAVTLRGPLGTPFPKPQRSPLVLMAGGFGAAPLLFAWDRLAEDLETPPRFVLGIPGTSWKALGDYVADRVKASGRIFSDDGSLGERGTPCHALEGAGEVWACGPPPMIRGLVRCAPPEMRLLVNLDSRMGCGYGGCLGCTVPTSRGNLRACVDGPFFDAREVDWKALEELEARS